MRQRLAPAEARAGAATVAVTAAAVAILGVLRETTGAFDPRPEITVLIVVSVFLATLALTLLRHRVARDRQLAAALRSWPLPRMDETDPYRLGVFPPRRDAEGAAAAEYLSRGDVDDDLKAALEKSPRGLALVYGPPRAGKSRTAFEAARSAFPGASVVAPRDGDALRGLLDLDPPLFSRLWRLPEKDRPSHAILWLDSLGRYLEAIDANLLDAFRASQIPVTLVATIREEEYNAALASTGPEGEGAKAVAAAARGFEVTADGPGARLASSGKERAEPGAATAVAPPTGPRVPEARPAADRLFLAPAAGSIACLAAILFISLATSFSKPVPLSLSEQADERLREAGGTVVWGPVKADLHGSGQESYLFAFRPEATAAGSESVAPSDEIRIYDQRGDELVKRFSFRPDLGGAEFQFRDLADFGAGGATLIGGYGFQNEASLALVPFVVRWDSVAGYTIDALQDERAKLSEGVNPKPEARTYLRTYRERVTLLDHESGHELSGYRVQDFAIVHDPDRLVSALAVDPKTVSEPGRVEVRGSILKVSGPDPGLIGCRFRDEPPPLLGTWSPDRLLYLELLDAWEPFIENRFCTPDL